ncbi:hypothetical protein CLV78_11458 [Aliiruegeria haliotis]|uniref:DUF2062 domain-containing protein n=1 Tax=Aliiruegeria haliotis TaxID=1280846 RepID=A0A2T0RGH4_9RHOB|nr:DUF2062 domain-containing protein [Aliiruegeria haliotis]PRY20273.1 hypothetical protein CLV78_11458 [Aliiruegeria haliotis]
MVFKRRDKRNWLQVVAESLWPRGGWGRAAIYVKHRIRRLPDKPHRIARGIFCGVFVSFTPFYGLHFLTAFLVAKAIGGNMLAALLATFFGNPVTFPFIAAIALKTGYWLLGLDVSPEIRGHLQEQINSGEFAEEMNSNLMTKFSGAFADLWTNFKALFTEDIANWDRLGIFYDQVFLPFLVGGILPGLITGLVAYHVTLPLITAYQNRRQSQLKRKLSDMRKASKAKISDTGAKRPSAVAGK